MLQSKSKMQFIPWFVYKMELSTCQIIQFHYFVTMAMYGKSQVFEHFGPKQPESDTSFKVECKHCHKSVIGSTKGTSNLLVHMKVNLYLSDILKLKGI